MPPAPRRWRLVAAAVVLLGVGVGAARQLRPPALPMQPGDRLLVADALLPAADSGNVRAITIALESALRQSARVNLLGPALVRESLKRMGREADSGRVNERTAIELAEREGARYVVVLSVVPAGASSQLTLRALAPGTGELVIAHRATTSPADVLAGIDELVSRLRHDFGDARSEIGRAVPLPRVMTASLEALTLYARGRDAYNRGKYNDARILYTLALDLDSAFASAHAALGGLESFTNHPALAEEHFTRALALAARLPPRERLLLDAEVARGRGDWVRAAGLHSAYLQRFPDDYDVHASLGYDQMRADNPAAALVAYDSAGAHGALTAGGWINVAAAHSLQDDAAAARRAYAEAFRRDTALLLNVIPNEEYGATLLRLGLADSARAVYRLLLSRAPANRVRAHRSLAYADLYEGRYASAIEHLQLGIALATADSATPLTQARDRVLLANTWREVGRAEAALPQVRLAARLCLTRPLEARMLFWTGKAAVRLGDLALARVLADSLRARARAANAQEQAALAGLEAELQVAAGHVEEGVAAARRAVEKGNNAVMLETLAHALNAAGQREELRITYELLRDQLPRSLGREGQQPARLAPLSLALMDAEAGRTAEARTRLDDFLAQWPDADADLTQLRELRRRLGQAPM
jgi:tetratricopeptide (TPR) repeat protein